MTIKKLYIRLHIVFQRVHIDDFVFNKIKTSLGNLQ